MDFFDEMTRVLTLDGTKRGVRCSQQTWQDFSADEVRNAVAEVLPQEEPLRVDIAQKQEILPEIVAEAMIQPYKCQELPSDWGALRNMALNCRNCRLASGRTNVVFGEGAENARLMFIGEGPGADEDATGRPFVGAAGQLLDKMIAAMHLKREEVYIANIVKCRPPGNRMPNDEEATACMGYLERQIQLIKPEVIVLLGGTAVHFLLNLDGITRLRGRWHEYNNIPVMPTFHPAFLLRNPEAKREAWNDLKMVMAKLNIPI